MRRPHQALFEDHLYSDADLIRRWSGQDIDLTRPFPPDLIMAAAQADPEIARAAGPYQAMLALPASLNAVQARVRDIYATGWRPPVPPGPTRDELVAQVTAAASSRSHPAQDAALPAAAQGRGCHQRITAEPFPQRRPVRAPHGSSARNGALSREQAGTLPRPEEAHLPQRGALNPGRAGRTRDRAPPACGGPQALLAQQMAEGWQRNLM